MKAAFALGLAAFFGFSINAFAADDLPKMKSFDGYEAEMKKSHFAVSSAPLAPSQNPAADLYISSLAYSSDECAITLRSRSDENFKEYISTKRPSKNGYRILNMELLDRVVPPKGSQ